MSSTSSSGWVMRKVLLCAVHSRLSSVTVTVASSSSVSVHATPLQVRLAEGATVKVADLVLVRPSSSSTVSVAVNSVSWVTS